MTVAQLIDALKKANPLARVVLEDEYDEYHIDAQLVAQSDDHEFVEIRTGRKPQTYEINWDGEEYLYKESK